jgi:hypothetical protein
MKLREYMQSSGGTVACGFLELDMEIPNYSKCHSFSGLVDSGQQGSYIP